MNSNNHNPFIDYESDLEQLCPSSLIENKIEEAIKPYYKLENVVRDLKKRKEKAIEAAVRVLTELNIWIKE